ncbi:Asp23/Gls24 family envelope stress response protein [Sanguibacter gelidistatuariae]|uniref:Asp23/Gls24 family envelope stress response protein n=1 Tax=Sanguibacter gelidistatuariae TaxID=1814289 RepID=UPI001C31B37E|nr:Asp23/Gls24 family envelope stress response protein [Sanguibacter gelidistatuariae]
MSGARPSGLIAPETDGEPETRGQLHISDRVVERVAGYAVTWVPDAIAAPRKVLGLTMGQRDTDDEAKVRVQVHGSVATVHAKIGVRWPASVRSVAEQVRSRIRADLAEITQVTVDHVDIDVVDLPPDTAHAARVR